MVGACRSGCGVVVGVVVSWGGLVGGVVSCCGVLVGVASCGWRSGSLWLGVGRILLGWWQCWPL